MLINELRYWKLVDKKYKDQLFGDPSSSYGSKDIFSPPPFFCS